MYNLLILICCGLMAPNPETAHVGLDNEIPLTEVGLPQNNPVLPWGNPDQLMSDCILILPSPYIDSVYLLRPDTIKHGSIVFSIWLVMPEQSANELVQNIPHPAVLLTEKDIGAIQQDGFLRISEYAKNRTKTYNREDDGRSCNKNRKPGYINRQPA